MRLSHYGNMVYIDIKDFYIFPIYMTLGNKSCEQHRAVGISFTLEPQLCSMIVGDLFVEWDEQS